MTRLVFDIETDGFLETMTTVHSLVIHDVDSGETWSCHNHYPTSPFPLNTIEFGLHKLMGVDLIIGHHIIGFDIPAIQKIYPWFEVADHVVFDTLVASKLVYPNLMNIDLGKIRINASALTNNEAGSHSLAAWGKRLGEWKGDYSDMMKAKGLDPWANWNPEMQEYCGQDVVVNTLLLKKIENKSYSNKAMKLEHTVATAMSHVMGNGFAFNEAGGEKLYVDLAGQREIMATDLRDLFPPWVVNDRAPFVAKVNNKRYGYVKGQTYQRKKTIIFNPNSGDQIADRLTNKYGWKPLELTNNGKPRVTDKILGELKYPEAQKLSKYKSLTKAISMLAEGPEAWLKHVKKDGRIYGNINSNGTVTSRATHSKPNLGQIPKKKGAYGDECRELFGKPYQLGCDVSGLELRMLGHYMAPMDGGKYAQEASSGDIHTINQKAAGLPNRDIAKTFIYAFLYGCGNAKLGAFVDGDTEEGGKLRKSLLRKLPALKGLIKGVKASAKERGFLWGLDGRRIPTRTQHSALNFLLQTAGALLCKQWIAEFVALLKEHDYYQKEVKIVAWVHDELQMEIDESLITTCPETGEHSSVIGELCIEAIERAGVFFDLKVPMTGEYKIGNNWRDCH